MSHLRLSRKPKMAHITGPQTENGLPMRMAIRSLRPIVTAVTANTSLLSSVLSTTCGMCRMTMVIVGG